MKLKFLADMAIRTVAHKFFGKRYPLVVSISVTSRCNLKCTYCYSYDDNINAHEVPTAELKQTVDELYKLGTRVIMLQGGEPLTHTGIAQIIDHIKSKGMYCSITTNGLSFKKHIESMKKLDQVQLSLDGDKELTDKFRGRGVYNAVIKAIKLCKEHRIPFHIHAIITDSSNRSNALEPLTALAKEYNTYLNFCFPTPRADDLATDIEHFREIYRQIIEEQKKGMPSNTSIATLQSIIDWGDRYAYNQFIATGSEEAKKHKKCVMGDLVGWLDSTGQLHPCAIHFGEEGFSYSIKEFGIAGAWDKLQTLPCHYCCNSTEFNHLFNLRPSAVLNALKFAKSN
ncbi:MAG: radical SAM protein [Magnetococcales bacterium]|nr:radical SAM protein [Magnetococcales bacterium]